jgi:DNA-3-methyladenine glycosylase I
MGSQKPRCPWAEASELLMGYHDEEWGIPVHDDHHLFEMLCLEGAQAGLSWQTILARRDTYRQAFDNFDVEKVARYDDAKREALLQDAGIIRNRLKVQAFVGNANATLGVRHKHGTLDAYLWNYVGDKKLTGADHTEAVAASERMSKGLKGDGFRFVGPTICYAYMQSMGMVNDHEPTCFRFAEVEALR